MEMSTLGQKQLMHCSKMSCYSIPSSARMRIIVDGIAQGFASRMVGVDVVQFALRPKRGGTAIAIPT